MSCKDKQECERLKDINLASVLASQEANLTKRKLAVVKLTHHKYGEYYKGIPFTEAKSKGLKIYDYFQPGKSMKRKKSGKNRKIDK